MSKKYIYNENVERDRALYIALLRVQKWKCWCIKWNWMHVPPPTHISSNANNNELCHVALQYVSSKYVVRLLSTFNYFSKIYFTIIWKLLCVQNCKNCKTLMALNRAKLERSSHMFIYIILRGLICIFECVSCRRH